MTGRCEIKGCRTASDLFYLRHAICLPHWNQLTNQDAPPDALRMALGIEAEPEPSMEITTMSKTKTEKRTDAKPEKAAKKREPKVKIPMRTVAIRVPEADFQLLHKAAGERNLSNFMKTTLLAAAQKSIAK